MRKLLLALVLTLAALTMVSEAYAISVPMIALYDGDQQDGPSIYLIANSLTVKGGVEFDFLAAADMQLLQNPPACADLAYTITAANTDPQKTNLTILGQVACGNVNFPDGFGLFVATPEDADAGTYTVTTRFYDTSTNPDTLLGQSTFTLKVVPAAVTLTLNAADPSSVKEGSKFEFTATTSRELAFYESLAFEAKNSDTTKADLSGWLTPVKTGNSVKYSVTPGHTGIGAYAVKVTLNDNSDTTPVGLTNKSFTLNVNNEAPKLDKLGTQLFSNLGTSATVDSAQSAKVVLLQAGQAYTADVTSTDPGLTTGDSVTYESSTEWPTFAMASTGRVSFTPSDEDIGMHYVTITVKDSSDAEESKTVRFFVSESTDDSKLNVRNVDVADITGDDDETQPGDTIKVTFDVTNILTKAVSNIKAKIWIEDADGKRFTEKAATDSFDLDAKDTKESNEFELVLDTDAKKSGSDPKTYYLVRIEVSGDDEDGVTHSDLFQRELKVFREEHKVVITDITTTPESGSCGSPVEFAVRTTNVGNTEEHVVVNVKNTALSLNQSSSQGTLKKEGSDSSKLTKLAVTIPANAAAANYAFDVKATFNDGASDVVVSKSLTVGCALVTGNTTTTGTISIASTSQTVNRGETGKYTITVTNTYNTTQNFKVTLSGVSDWGEARVENGDISLAPGASVPVYVYVTPKSDASAGVHTATAQISAGSTLLDTKTLSTTVGIPTTTVTDYSRAGTGAAVGLPALSSGDLTNAAFAAVVVIVVVLVGLFAWFKPGVGSGKAVQTY
jgi:hypothetical protein